MVAVSLAKKDKPSFFISRMDYALSNFLVLCGFRRVNEIRDADVVVFGGGADINPFLYGENRNRGTVVSYECDITDIKNLKLCGDFQSKVGICRGAQFLNVMVGGGKLYQHVSNHSLSGTHQMKLMQTKGYEHYSPLVDVTSTHHQMMIPGDNGEVVYAANIALEKCTDSSVQNYTEAGRVQIYDDPEVIRYYDRSTLCYQPHPEYDGKHNRDNKEVFLALLLESCIDKKFHGDCWEAAYALTIK